MMHLLSLAATPTLDFEHPLVELFVDTHSSSSASPRANAVSLYYAVRDMIRYDPYKLDLTLEGMMSSTTLKHGYAWCVPKAVLLAACCRRRGIPARLGFGDVRNHMSTKRMREKMQTDVFFWHGFTEILLDDRWVKATPAFNRELCERFGLAPLEFDGRADSIFHAFDQAGNRHMEYLQDRGRYEDLPLAEILATFKTYYGAMVQENNADFEQDIIEEIGS